MGESLNRKNESNHPHEWNGRNEERKIAIFIGKTKKRKKNFKNQIQPGNFGTATKRGTSSTFDLNKWFDDIFEKNLELIKIMAIPDEG